MVTHRRTLLICVASFFALVAACDKVPLLAPTGSVINLILSTTNASLNSEVTIIATVIENGTSSGGSGTGTGSTAQGTPVQNGTVITFTTTIGSIEPSEARTHNGQVTVKLLTGSTSGTASITAYSGGASKNISTLKIGTAAAKLVNVTTTPQTLGASGGTAQVLVTVVDEGGNGVGGVPVTLATDKGSISPSTVTTDSSGSASAVLTTTLTAKVTATVGLVPAVTGTATVTVNARSLTSFSATNASTASTGVPVVFQVTAAATNVSNVHVDFGDGFGTDVGVITALTSVPHAYSSPGTYTATASVAGESGLSTTVTVGALSVTLTATPPSPIVNTPVLFAVSLGASPPQIDHYTWTLDDGTGPFTTTAPSLSHVFTTRGLKNVRVDVFGVSGGKIATASLVLEVQ
jgi:hypothetical protein